VSSGRRVAEPLFLARRSTRAGLVLRARIVLSAAAGERDDQIAEKLGCTRRTVGVWRRLFVEDRIGGIEKDAPEHAIVLSCDEKSQIQATQPSLPIYPGRCGTLTHDYKRNGTTTLLTAIDVVEETVISECMKRHRHQEWIRFLETIDDGPRVGHLIVGNYAIPKHPKVQRWLYRHPRFQVHFVPTSSSWLNLVEPWFRELTEKNGCVEASSAASTS
jgi:hypothetical protein